MWLTAMLPVVVAGFGQLVLQARRTQLTWADVVLASIPAAAIVVLALIWSSAALVIVLPVLLLGVAGAVVGRRWIEQNRRVLTWVTALVIGLVVIGAAIACDYWPVAFPRSLGPLSVLTLGLSLIGLMLALAALRPALATLYFVVCVVAASLGPGSRPVQLTAVKAAPDRPDYATLDEEFGAWVRARPDLEDYRQAHRPYPIIIATAEGGGIYAASHAYLALSGTQEVCPSFTNHLFATIGVSGGAIGTALYAARTPQFVRRGRLAPCHALTKKIDVTPVTVDLLSPPLANLLLVQPLDFLIPGPALFHDSGEATSASIGEMVPDNDWLRQPLRSTWRADGIRPATLFVSTDVHSGNRFILSPLSDAGSVTADSYPSGKNSYDGDIAVSNAA